ncbi:MAG: hypothetical protein KGS72_07840 [Cyanobacteria bacterium REEB67]|nr:hypothetical protein [Cyanobacteria bacterium REEB67]
MAGHELSSNDLSLQAVAVGDQPNNNLDRYQMPSPLALELESITGPKSRSQFSEKSPAWGEVGLDGHGISGPGERHISIQRLSELLKEEPLSFEKSVPMPVSAERVEAVRAEMEGRVNQLIPANVQAILKEFRDGALDANPLALQHVMKELQGNPKMLHDMVKELNEEFSEQGSPARFGLTDDNRLLLSADAKNGVVIDSRSTQSRTVTPGGDGYLHLSQEQRPSPTSAEVMSQVREETCAEKSSHYFSDPYSSLKHQFRPLFKHHFDPDTIIDLETPVMQNQRK